MATIWARERRMMEKCMGVKKGLKRVNDQANVVFGSFGFGNLGDELVPDCFRRLLREAGIHANIKVLSRFEGAKLGESTPFPDLLDPHKGPQSGTIVLVGGGIVEPRDYSCMNRAFQLQSKRPNLRVTAHAISVEPGVRFSWSRRRQLERQLRHIELPTVRDVLSAEILMRLVPGASTRVVGDIGLWTEPELLPEPLTRILPRRSIAVILGDCWGSPDFIDWLADEIILLARGMDSGVLLLPFSGAYGMDFDINQRLRKKMEELNDKLQVVSALDHMEFEDITPGIAAALLQLADLTISTRLHGCVISYAMGTPFLALAYHPKLRGFVETVGNNNALIPGKLPLLQSSKTYGYKFSDLEMRSGVLSDRADSVIPHFDFSATPYFRRLQIESIRELFERSQTASFL